MTVLVRLIAAGFMLGFGCCALYSAARDRRVEAVLYSVAVGAVLVMVIR